MEEQSTKFTMTELAFMYGLIKSARADIQECLQELDPNDPERDFALDAHKTANSCYRKLKAILSEKS